MKKLRKFKLRFRDDVVGKGCNKNPCEGKLRYNREQAIKRALGYGPFVQAYQCVHCQKWHVGHMPGSK